VKEEETCELVYFRMLISSGQGWLAYLEKVYALAKVVFALLAQHDENHADE